MKIVYVVGRFPKTSETFVLREVRELLLRGTDLTVWSLRPPEADDPAPVDADGALEVTRYLPTGWERVPAFADALVRAFASRPRASTAALGWAVAWSLRERDWRPLAAVPYAAWLAAQIAPDAHVHAHFANTPATVTCLVAQLTGVRWSFTGHARDVVVMTSRRFLGAKVHAARAAVVETEFVARHVRATAPSQSAKVRIVRNGLAPSELSAAPSGARNGGPVVAVGRLVEKKGFDTLVDAAALLRDRGVEAMFRIVGEGPSRAALERRIRERSVADRVRLVGALDARGVRAELAAAVAFALPCRVDGAGDVDSWPAAIIEALAHRAPVVTTPVGGIAEMVEDGVSGLLVPPGDAAALADALERLLADRALRERIAENGRAVAEREALVPNVDRLMEVFAAGR